MIGDIERMHELVVGLCDDLLRGERTKTELADAVMEMVKAIKVKRFDMKYRQ